MRVIWAPSARVELRAIDQQSDLNVLRCVDRYLSSRAGDIRKLSPPFTGFRLRCGDQRVFFEVQEDQGVTITSVQHRKEA